MKQDQSGIEKTIQKLKDELYLTRYSLLSLIAEPYHKILTSYYLQTKQERYQWLNDAIQEILDLTLNPLKSTKTHTVQELIALYANKKILLGMVNQALLFQKVYADI